MNARGPLSQRIALSRHRARIRLMTRQADLAVRAVADEKILRYRVNSLVMGFVATGALDGTVDQLNLLQRVGSCAGRGQTGNQVG